MKYDKDDPNEIELTPVLAEPNSSFVDLSLRNGRISHQFKKSFLDWMESNFGQGSSDLWVSYKKGNARWCVKQKDIRYPRAVEYLDTINWIYEFRFRYAEDAQKFRDHFWWFDTKNITKISIEGIRTYDGSTGDPCLNVEMFQWLESHASGRWCVTIGQFHYQRSIIFNNVQDAILFKLVFGGS